MKIAYCILGTFSSGGIERVLANKANALVKRGVEVYIITTDQAGRKPFYALDERIQCYDLDINYMSRRNPFYWQKAYHYWDNIRKHKQRLKALLKRLQVDITISMNGFEVYFLPSIHDGSKKILEFHIDYDFFQFFKRKGLKGLFDRYIIQRTLFAIKKYNRFVILTHEDAINWSRYEDILEIIPNARTFDNEQSVALLENKKVLAVGRYTHQKGFERLIQAWSLVHKTIKDWTLHIVGDGELRQALQCQINELHLQDSVFLDGPSSHIREKYLESSILAVSSYHEGFSMVILEAESFGVPVVSFACPCGPRDIIRDGEDGFLVPNGDVQQLAGRLMELMENENMRKEMGRKAFLNSKRFSEEVVMEKWMWLFHQLTGTLT